MSLTKRLFLGLTSVVVGSAITACGGGNQSAGCADCDDQVTVGILHSLSGTMAISESTLVDTEKMAIEEINAAGGVKVGGKNYEIKYIVEDGASDWPTFAEKSKKLIESLGFIEQKLCFIQSNVGTRKGGSIDYATSLKGLRAAQIAKENKLPTINLVESGGVNLNDQDKIFNNAGATFREITNRSKLGLSTISLVFGNATAGGAYVPGMSDYTVFQKKKAKVFLAGPPLVKMALKGVPKLVCCFMINMT